MNDAPGISERVLRFIADRIDTVPELEALLLLWQDPDKRWRVEEIAQRLYVTPDAAASILRALHMRQLAAAEGQSPVYRYSSAWDESGRLMAEVDETYRHNVVRIATFIHSGGSSAVREFARAFDFTRERRERTK